MRWLRHPVTGAIAASLLVAALGWVGRNEEGNGFYERAERSMLDTRFTLRGKTRVDPSIAIVVLDDATVARESRLIERRSGWARLVRAIHQAGAKVIGIDALFSEPERPLGDDVGPRVVAWAAAHPQVEQNDSAGRLLGDVARELSGDEALALAFSEAPHVVLGVFASETQRETVDPSLSRARYGQSTLGDVSPHQVRGIDASLPALNASVRGMGLVGAGEDETGQVRRFDGAIVFQDGVYLPLSVAMLAAHAEVNRGRLAYVGPQQRLKLGDRSVDLQSGAFWLNFRGPEGTFDTYSAIDVLEGKLPAGALQGKTVLVGQTRLGYDRARGPFGFLPGVEVQATALDNLLAQDVLVRSTRWQDLAATFGLGLLIALLFASSRLKPGAHAAIFLLVLGAWLFASFYAFKAHALWLPWVGPSVSAAAALVVGLALAFATEAGKRRFLKKAFSHYLGKDALEKLLEDPGKLELGGEKRHLSVLFSDICGFTTLSEKLPPDKLVAFLNTYLSPMTRAVLSQGGLLDKYIGDAVMAVFGAPVPDANHASTALSCALTMHADLEALNAGPLKDLGEPLRIGVGVNTGDMVVGNMGSEDRFDYTVAGDAVNLASRLEGLTRAYGVFCLVGEATRAAAGPQFTFRALDLVQVKGKNTAAAIFELVSGPSRTLTTLQQLEKWSEGFEAFRSGRLGEARAAFTAFHAANPTDVPVQRFLDRLAALPEVAPPDFSPVAVFHSK